MPNVRLQSLPSPQYVALLNERMRNHLATPSLPPVRFEILGHGRAAHTNLLVTRVDHSLVRQAMTAMQSGGLFCHPPINRIVDVDHGA